MDIIAYTYEADYHCIDCTNKRFAYYHTGIVRDEHVDWWGIYEDQKDSEGNFVHPVFVTDEWQEFDEGYQLENPTQYLACGDCHGIIDEYKVESEVTP